MTIYKPKKSGEKAKKPSSGERADDETLFENELVDRDDVRLVATISMARRRRNAVLLTCFILLTIFIIVAAFASLFIFNRSTPEPFKALVRMNYHEWKTSAAGVPRAFQLEGEFYQQVEIDIQNGEYEKLNVPSLLNSKKGQILHDFNKEITAIIDWDHGRCLILPLNRTFVKAPGELYKLVQHIKAGYDSPTAEVIRDNYYLYKPSIDNIGQFGPYVYRECQFFETHELIRQDRTVDQSTGVSKRSTCYFENDQYCLGSAGTDFMGIVFISKCI